MRQEKSALFAVYDPPFPPTVLPPGSVLLQQTGQGIETEVRRAVAFALVLNLLKALAKLSSLIAVPDERAAPYANTWRYGPLNPNAAWTECTCLYARDANYT